MNRRGGFTLIELVVALVVAAIVLTIGVPSFQELINNNRLTSAANEFVTALNLTRSEAIKRNMRVTLCKSADGATCAVSGHYQQGWIVFNDPNNNATVDPPNEQVIRAYGPLSGGLTLTGNTTVINYISFVPSGVSQLIGGGFQAGTLTLCKTNYTASGRWLVLSRGGRVRVVREKPPTAPAC